MWCSVQECRGPSGEKLKRREWAAPVQGELTIGNGKHFLVAALERTDVDRRYQVLFPLGDVRVVTLDDGLLVVGYRIAADGVVTREFRQAWFCVPTIKG